MPRRELLTPSEQAQLFAFPQDEGELIRLATLARADLTYIRQHRGDHNRLGLAIQMVYLRHPSRVLAPSEAPHVGTWNDVGGRTHFLARSGRIMRIPDQRRHLPWNSLFALKLGWPVEWSKPAT